eukprot:4173794-Pleurochrysis_carterae.AAC.2
MGQYREVGCEFCQLGGAACLEMKANDCKEMTSGSAHTTPAVRRHLSRRARRQRLRAALHIEQPDPAAAERAEVPCLRTKQRRPPFTGDSPQPGVLPPDPSHRAPKKHPPP